MPVNGLVVVDRVYGVMKFLEMKSLKTGQIVLETYYVSMLMPLSGLSTMMQE